MELLNLLISGFVAALQPLNLVLIISGCALGLFIGAMPGLGSVNGVAIMLPMTFLVPPTKEAVAAVTSAVFAFPCNAKGRPSNVVATAVEAPGIPNMIELMAPPYIAP